jgi:hypothetical protein
VIVVALILAVAGFSYALVRGSPPDPVEAVAPENVGPEAATRSMEPSGPPPSDPTVTAAPPPSGTCGREAATQQLPAPADVVPAPVADYRFRHTYGSEVGNAPDLVQAGRNASAFVFDASIGRPVLSFSRHGGLALTPATRVVDLETYTIELLFRFDRVQGYRKIVDFRDGSDDRGLYVRDGCLTFFPVELPSRTEIEHNAYVHIVLTRNTEERVVGYVDAARQFAFIDQDGLAEIATDTLRFFVDDSETRQEYSEGAVTQIRLHDRSLTASEVAALACSVRDVPIANEWCPG